ncbi:DUF2461 domain-containing protein [Belliella aquatica]|uniref:TIGR02453 family protein n=1 Tax=Belliella aquatica TaxID=1323734 RepID=A0ABQ1MKW1_9BACT|nr:DUF2461 domain-containing protein [Belliella aquatica]MCH7405341.1 DUF2461 domain-containing protein [Belliella aquatica]GGC42400.1 TIGR02453 family protein [Belliella aquatica]
MPTPYLDFLKELASNNSKEWMDANRDWYQKVRGEFIEDVGELLGGITSWEPALTAFKAKDCVFRQNRDIRFSANKAPYKTNLAAYFSVGGKKSNDPGYYLHIQPGGSFIAGGIWMPPADILKKIRQEIDYSGEELLKILNEPTFKKHFSSLEGEQLKTSPRDYDAEHPHIDLLRYKSFIVSTPLADKDISSGNFKTKTLDTFRLMKPFHDFLHKAVDEAESGEGLL